MIERGCFPLNLTISLMYLVQKRNSIADFVLSLFLMSCLFVPIQTIAQQQRDLNYFLTKAKENSPVLNDYNQQVYSLKIDSLKLKAEYGIKVNGILNTSYAPILKGWGYDEVLSNGQELISVIRISKDFLGKNNIGYKFNDYSLGIKQLVNKSQINIVQLTKAITEQYINTYYSQKEYDILLEIRNLFLKEDIVLNKLTQNSTFSQTDYLTFQVNVKQNTLVLKQCEVEWQDNYAVLNYLCGIVDTNVQKISTPNLPQINVKPYNEGAYEQSYLIDSLKLFNRANIINSNYSPQLSAFMDGGYSSSFLNQPYKNFGLNIGLSLSIPIYDGNQKNMLLQQNQIELETKGKYNEFARRQYNQQILMFNQQIQQYNQMISLAKEQLNYSNTLIEANLRQFLQGDVKIADFILSINNYLNLKLVLLQYETKTYNLNNQLNNITIQP